MTGNVENSEQHCCGKRPRGWRAPQQVRSTLYTSYFFGLFFVKKD